MAFRRRFKKRFTRRRTSSSRRLRFRRRMGRMMRRRNPRPEIKWLERFNTADTTGEIISPGQHVTFTLTPTVIGQGTGRNQRIGNIVKFRWCKFMLNVRSVLTQNVANQATRIRVLIISQRIDNTIFDNYLNNEFVPRTNWIDTNLCHVHYDKEFTLTNLTGVANYASGQLQALDFNKSIRFPRKVEFRTGNDGITDGRDQLRLIVCNMNELLASNITYFVKSKTTYIDN